jgi:branched-subunit amino acid ABC-type transport system permease component
LLAPGLAPTPVKVYQVFGTAVTLDQVIAYGCVLAIVVVGALILRFTEAGLSVRAMVDSEAMTSLSGSNPTRIAAGVWVVSTFLAGLVGILNAPIVGLDANKFVLLMAAAFAAVIAARLRSLPIAVVVALLMGVTRGVAQYYLPSDSQLATNIIPAIPFAFVVISLIVNLARAGRVNEEEGVGGALDRAIKPHGGIRLAASADTENLYPRLNFWFPALVFGGIVILALTFSTFWVGVLMTGVCLAVVFMSYTLVTGEGGMLWLCQMTFAGAGALTTAQLATQHGWPILLAVVGGGVVAAAMGVIIGAFTIRLGNLYIALVTLTFGLPMEVLVFPQYLSNSGVGSLARPSFAESDRVHPLRPRSLRGDCHPHRESAPVDYRPRAERSALERDRVPHDGPLRHPDEGAHLRARRLRGRRRRRAVRHREQASHPGGVRDPARADLVGRARDLRRAFEHRRAPRGLRVRALARIRAERAQAEHLLAAGPRALVQARCGRLAKNNEARCAGHAALQPGPSPPMWR